MGSMTTQELIKSYLEIIRKYKDAERDIKKLFGHKKGEELLWALSRYCDAQQRAEDFKMNMVFNKRYGSDDFIFNGNEVELI